MEESSNLPSKAREILVNPSYEEIAIIVNQLFMRQDSVQYETSRLLYNFWVSHNPSCLTLKLLKVYQSSSNGVLRFRSIYQLSETLTDFKFKPSLDSLYEIKPLLISFLTNQETKESDVKILKRIVSCVAYNVVVLHKDKWDELSDCILTLANSEPLKAFHVFIDLPRVYKEFIDKFLEMILQRAENVLLSPARVQDWSLAFQTFVKMWIQLVDTGMNFKKIRALMAARLSTVVKSVIELVNEEEEEFLVQGLEDFERFFSRDMNLYHYTKDQSHFVLASMIEIEGVVRGTETKEIVRKIKMLVTEPESSAIKPQDGLKYRRDEFESSWYDYLKSLSSLEVLKIFASTDLEDRSREIAIRRVNVLLSDHFSKKAPIDISEFRKLQPLLISCLKEEGISDSLFKVLGQVVNHVANEMFVFHYESWDDLRDYFASQSETEFQRAVYIFQCLTIPLIDDDFLNPVMENLCPVISTRLDPPTELLVDNSCWVLAFTSAFCAVIHMIEDPGYAESPKEIAYKMIESVRKLVEREMEVGLVRRAFRDVETIVKKQLEWYGKFEYKFVKGLLWRLYAVKGMKWESKIVLWRINVIVERGVKKVEKELPKEDEFDWLNLRDDDDEDDDDDDEEIYQELALDDAAVTEALELHKIRAVNGQFSKLVL
ncbi:unnamed protein product [Arabidopsis arenosa]|uniref:DUF577 domain-containing protein n=1 Tax=Arabidopsis arenosa TaxID=38785 RepID=A0A8S2AVT0_ARAAE|nr:unnamed protein product [Arabidopsis arenosa]